MNKSNCEKCIHTEVCRIKDFLSKFEVDASSKFVDHNDEVEIDIRCKYFEEKVESITGTVTIKIPAQPDSAN